MTLSGRFVLPSGKPAGGVRLAAEASYGDGGNGVLSSMTTGADGVFTLNVETARPFKLSVTPGEGLVSGTLRADSTVRPGSSWSEGIWVLEPVAGTSTLSNNITLAAGHIVSGTVTVSGPLSLTDARLEVWSDAARFEAPITVKTGTTAWKITLPAGSYRASVQEYGVGISAYHGGDSAETATAFPVNGTVTGIGIAATVSSHTVSGTVRNAAGQPVPDASVGISPRPWATDRGRSTTTTADGTYTLVNLQPGTYELSFGGSGPTVYWPGTDDPDAAELISVTTQTTALTGYDGTVSEGVRISGTSTDPNGTPREGDQVRFVKNGREFSSVTTAADGTYRSWGLPAGEYAVSIVQGGFQGQIEQWYDGKRSAAEANLVDAAEDGTEYGEIDFVAVAGATMKGTIRFADHSPVAGAEVSVYAAQNLENPVGATRTGADGRYSIPGLRADNYVVKASSGSSGVVDAWFGATEADPSPRVISLGVDGSFTADFEAHLGGTVRGTVYPPSTGQPIFLTLMRTDETGYRSLTLPASDGDPIDWEVSGLEGIWMASVDGRYWPDLSAPEDASVIEVAPGQVIDGIDFDLRSGVNLSASFSTSDGSAIAYMHLVIERDQHGWWERVTDAGSSDPEFAFALAAGSYRLRANGTTTAGDALRDTERSFTITNGQTTDLRITTALGWEINGQVTDAATGEPVAGVDLSASSSAGGGGNAMSRPDGTYRLVVGATGAWTVTASGYSDVYAPSPREVTVVDAKVDGVDISLTRGHRLSGRVTAENNGNPLSGVTVEVQGADGSTLAWLATQIDGTYSTSALPTGAYRLRFSNWNGLYIEEWWDGAVDRASATDVVVDRKAVANIDASMRLGGVVAGSVRDAAGAPLSEATVGLATLPPSGIGGFFAPLGRLFGIGGDHPILGVETTTDAEGNYRLPPTESGSYALYVYSRPRAPPGMTSRPH